MTEPTEQEPLPIRVPWRLLLSFLGVYVIAAFLLGFWISAWIDIETKHDLTKADSLEVARAENADARARDSLETLRRWYAYRTDSMELEWKKTPKKRKRAKHGT
jgi:hypothetical protein